MTEVDRRDVEMLREEYESQIANLSEMQRRMSEISATAVSPRRELSVTVSHQGVITELKFLTSAYRGLAKNELAELVTRTIAEARDKVTDQTAQLLAPLMPPGLNARDLLTRTTSAEVRVPDESRLPPTL